MSKDTWDLREAKKWFGQVVNKAVNEGPQTVTHNGEEIVVIISMTEYNQLQKSKSSLVEFFRGSPLVGVELDLERDKSLPKDSVL